MDPDGVVQCYLCAGSLPVYAHHWVLDGADRAWQVTTPVEVAPGQRARSPPGRHRSRSRRSRDHSYSRSDAGAQRIPCRGSVSAQQQQEQLDRPWAEVQLAAMRALVEALGARVARLEARVAALEAR